MALQEAPKVTLTGEALTEQTVILFAETLKTLQEKSPEAESLILRHLKDPQEPRDDMVRFDLGPYKYTFRLVRDPSKKSLHLHDRPLQHDLNTDSINLELHYGPQHEIIGGSFSHTKTLHNIDYLPETCENTVAAAQKIRDWLHSISEERPNFQPVAPPDEKNA